MERGSLLRRGPDWRPLLLLRYREMAGLRLDAAYADHHRLHPQGGRGGDGEVDLRDAHSTTGCTPKGAVAGMVKLTCEMPTSPIGTPAKETVAVTPPTVTVTGSFGRGSLAVAVPVGGLAPVIRNVVVSPSPVMYAVAVWPCLPVADGVSEPSAAVNRPGAAGATVKGKLATCPLLFTPNTASPLPEIGRAHV